MKKRIWLLLLIVLASILLTGCALQTVDEMYALPKRSKEYDSLQSAIDSAMYGLSYSAPVSGENQQTVQMADLDGDGVEEYIVFAQGNSANPLQVLIFRQEEDGTCRLMEVIQSNGSAFEQVEYVQMDNAPRLRAGGRAAAQRSGAAQCVGVLFFQRQRRAADDGGLLQIYYLRLE